MNSKDQLEAHQQFVAAAQAEEIEMSKP